MIHPDDDTRSSASAAAGKPTLEALLRLKRAERPDPAFWEEFDRGLRQKQLAAIIEPKPWWLGLELIGRRLIPFGLPVSAAAAALLAVMAVRTQTPFTTASEPVEFGPNVSVARSEPVVAVSEPAAPASVEIVSAAAGHESAPGGDASARELAPEVAPPSEPLVARAPTEPVIPALLEIDPSLQAVPPTASELIITQNLKTVSAEEPALVASATQLSLSGKENAEAASSEMEPALKMEVRNPRHARVLLAMADNPSVEASGGIAHLRDRMVRSLVSDDALGGAASRLGVGGDRLSVSF